MPIGTAGGPRRWSSGSNFTPQQPPRPPPGGRRVGERWNKRRNNGDEKTGFGKPPNVRLCIRYVPELGLVSVLERQERELDLRYAPIIRYVPELGLVSVLERRERELDLLLRPHYASH